MGHPVAEEFDVEAPGSASNPAARVRTFNARLVPLVWGALGVLLIVLGVVIAPTPAALARGVVPSLSQQPTLQWREQVSTVRNADGAVWIDGDVVLANGAAVIRALDIETGERLWEVYGEGRVVCNRGGEVFTCVSGQGERARLLELTAQAGEIGRITHPYLINAVPYRGGVITLYDSGATATLTRVSQGDEHQWSASIELPADLTAESISRMSVIDGLLLMDVPASARPAEGLPVVDIGSGQVREDLVVTDRRNNEWLLRDDVAGTVYTTTERRWQVGELDLAMGVDDEPATGLTFGRRDHQVVAQDGRSGEVVWDFDDGSGEAPLPQARASEVVMTWSQGELVGLEAATGEPLWRAPSSQPQCPCLTDTRTVSFISYSGGAVASLVGLDVASGQENWRVDVGQTARYVFTTDGRYLVMFTETALSVWSLT